jgi:hypothetical protein
MQSHSHVCTPAARVSGCHEEHSSNLLVLYNGGAFIDLVNFSPSASDFSFFFPLIFQQQVLSPGGEIYSRGFLVVISGVVAA